jgi:hypothetical protein
VGAVAEERATSRIFKKLDEISEKLGALDTKIAKVEVGFEFFRESFENRFREIESDLAKAREELKELQEYKSKLKGFWLSLCGVCGIVGFLVATFAKVVFK